MMFLKKQWRTWDNARNTYKYYITSRRRSLTLVDFKEHSNPMAGAVFVVITKVPKRCPGNHVDLIEFKIVRKSEWREVDGCHQHPRVCFYLLWRRLAEMYRPRNICSTVCTQCDLKIISRYFTYMYVILFIRKYGFLRFQT